MFTKEEPFVSVCVQAGKNDVDLLIGGCRVALGTTKNTQKSPFFWKSSTSVPFSKGEGEVEEEKEKHERFC